MLTVRALELLAQACPFSNLSPSPSYLHRRPWLAFNLCNDRAADCSFESLWGYQSGCQRNFIRKWHANYTWGQYRVRSPLMATVDRMGSVMFSTKVHAGPSQDRSSLMLYTQCARSPRTEITTKREFIPIQYRVVSLRIPAAAYRQRNAHVNQATILSCNFHAQISAFDVRKQPIVSTEPLATFGKPSDASEWGSALPTGKRIHTTIPQ